jgi:hypothetical protein
MNARGSQLATFNLLTMTRQLQEFAFLKCIVLLSDTGSALARKHEELRWLRWGGLAAAPRSGHKARERGMI